jgi:transposase
VARGELEAGIEDGLSINQLAAQFGCSEGTVRHWLSRYGLRTQNPARRASTAAVIAARA